MSIIPFPVVSRASGDDMPDDELIRRYDGHGPRYTSYPTALQFGPQFGPREHRAAIARACSGAPQAPLSVYVHVPFCASPCFYCGCTKITTRQTAMADVYLQHLLHEIELQAGLFAHQRPIAQLHLGGGTPTYFSQAQLAQLLQALERQFGWVPAQGREFSIEVDPRSVDPQAISSLAALGFNRLSFGIQDFDPAVQRAVNRLQTLEEVEALVAAARREHFQSISMDLIYGLPLQTPESFARTLDAVIALRPDRIASYSYAHLPQRFKAQRRIRSEQLPTPAVKLQLLRLTVERLIGAGYQHIGMDHFALPDDELSQALGSGKLQRNFQGYSTYGDLDLLGLGMSSISRLADSYSQNARTLGAYYAALDQHQLPVDRGLRLTADDRLRRDVINALMCRGELFIAEIEKRHGIVFAEYFADALRRLEPLEQDGLLRREPGMLIVTPRGRHLLRAIAMPFDAYLPAAAPASGGQYSRVI